MKTLTQEEKNLLKPIFWDTDIDNLDPDKHTRYIIERILQFGLAEHVNWMLKNYTDNEIIQAIIQSRIIDRKTANFWSIHFGINKDEILCFTKPQSIMSNSMF